MQISEYYDSIAFFWDDDYSEAKPARMAAARLSIPRGGACVLDIKTPTLIQFNDLPVAYLQAG